VVDDVAPDGSPVEVYRALPAGREPAIIHAAVPAGASLLELGCGTGRVTVALAALGHRITAVDQSAAMLANLPDDPAIESVQADIETLDLGRHFDAVLLGSHLLNTPDGLARQFLAAAERHLEPGGLALVEVYPPATDWVASVGRRSVLGDVGITIVRATVRETRLEAAVVYDVDGRSWEQAFEADMLDEPAIRDRLEDGGFAFDRWLDASSGWLAAGRRS
jgi:SAM-dependent methyltransferase